ncbi:aromatic ring-hydroxylating oxygenase subunit alpha [Spirillospora sp. CA-294931]|uniref:aromatic ring-hydroxylating oxygenase subunit alpha n=1 Tax=Spirillospora sp. CA-294931 TaxID=3240042 RepID=UPI003D8ED77F
MIQNVGSIVDEVCRVANLPLERGETLPPAAYTSPEFYALEVERVFRREWQCVGRVDQLPRTGDYLAVELFGEPIVITRDEHGDLHALSRVCRHRFMDLLPPETAPREGNVPRLTCPYHTWVYRLDGQYAGRLAGAPLMGKVDFERRDCHLPKYGLEVWQGFVFVNLDPGAEPLAPRLAGLEKRLGAYDFSTWVTADTMGWEEIGANWKVAVENGVESYHHLGTHAESLQPVLPAQRFQAHESDGIWFTGLMPVAREFAESEVDGYPIMPTMLPSWPGLTPEQRSGMLAVVVFPLFAIAVSPDSATWFRWVPTGPQSHSAELRLIVPPGSTEVQDFAELVEGGRSITGQIQSEDIVALQGVQRGLASRTAHRGRFSDLERGVWQFQRYLADRVAPGRES